MSRTHGTSQAASSERKRWLCIAYAFPPINRSGTHRTLAFVRHLDRLGWDASVLTVEPKDEPVDRLLMEEVPPSAAVMPIPWVDLVAEVKQVLRVPLSTRPTTGTSQAGTPRIHADNEACKYRRRVKSAAKVASGFVRAAASQLLITPDSRAGWVWPAARAGMRHICARRPHVIYSTSPYASAHLIALILSRRTGVPWVADFRDPWRDNPFRRSGSAIAERWDALLERMVLRQAKRVVCNTPTMAERLCQRVPFVRQKCSTILNGYDQELIDKTTPLRTARRDVFVLTHAGQFYGRRSPEVLFAALRRALDCMSRPADSIKMLFIGSKHYGGNELRTLAVEAGVGANVELLGQLSHANTLSYLAGSDALLLVGTSGVGSELQVPNKLFEYMGMRKPIIAAVSAENPAITILSGAGAQAIVCEPGDDVAIARAIIHLANGRIPPLEDAWSGVTAFDRLHRSVELAELFRAVSAMPERTTCRTVGHGDHCRRRRPRFVTHSTPHVRAIQ
ncbi:MAG: glycosyltransferase family 4 protein [Phycisphaerae bacterium]